jgi:Protein of unknown function with PCYCGC motif
MLVVTNCAGQSEQKADAQAAQVPAALPPPAPSPDGAPPIPMQFAARPPEVIRVVYTFAADHPEVLSHVPCFCGCQNRGHRNNDNCFVARREADGRVAAWEPHGAT